MILYRIDYEEPEGWTWAMGYETPEVALLEAINRAERKIKDAEHSLAWSKETLRALQNISTQYRPGQVPRANRR